MQEFIVSDKAQRIRFLDHLSFSLSEKTGRCGERVFSEGRAAVRFFLKQEEEREKLKREISDLLAVGYKYEYFQSKLAVCLGKKEKKYLLCAMIAADLGKKALGIFAISDNLITGKSLPSKEREVGFGTMMELALSMEK